MAQRPGGGSVSVTGWWTPCCMPCSRLWAGRTRTTRWAGSPGKGQTHSPHKGLGSEQEPWSTQAARGRHMVHEWEVLPSPSDASLGLTPRVPGPSRLHWPRHAPQRVSVPHPLSPQSVENCVCIVRNLSYHVHKEVPGAERYQEAEPGPPGSSGSAQRRSREDAGCFGGKKAKGVWAAPGFGSRIPVPLS